MSHENRLSEPNRLTPVYQIRVKGHLEDHWASRFDGMVLTMEPNGDTTLTGPVVDQATLHGLLRQIRDVGLPLVAVTRLDEDESSEATRLIRSRIQIHRSSSTKQELTKMNNATSNPQPKNVIVFGATGTTGSAIVERALELGYNVTAFVRTPSKVTIQHDNLSIFKGDVLDSESVEQAVMGHDAVISTLGAGLNGTVRSEGTLNIIRAMEKANVRRFISQSSLGVGDSRANLNFYWKHIMFGMLLRKAYADHGKQEQYIRESNLDWTIVRPGALKEGPLTNTYRQGFGPTVRDITLDISIADTADFMVRQIEDTAYLGNTPALSY